MMVNDDGVVILTSLSLRCCRLERFLWHCMALFAVTCSDFSCDMLCHTVPKFAEVSQSGLTSHSFSLILQCLILMEQKLALQILALAWALKVERSVGNIIRSYSNPVGWHSLGSKWLEPNFGATLGYVRSQDDQRWSCWQARCMRWPEQTCELSINRARMQTT